MMVVKTSKAAGVSGGAVSFGAVLAVTALLGVSLGCSARLAPSRLARVFHPLSQPGLHSPSRPVARMSRPSARQVRAASAVDRAMEMHTQGSFDPLRDDARLRSLREAVAASPANVPARLQLAQRYEGYGLADKALEEYLSLLPEARTQLPYQINDASEGLSLLPAVLHGVARNGLRAQRAAEAVDALAGEALMATNASLSLQLGLLYDQLGDPDKAESAYRAAVRLEPESAPARNNLGYRLMQRGELAEAEQQFRAALAVAGGSATAHNNLGMLLTQRGDYAAAWEQFHAGSADAATARNNYAVALMSAGKWMESREQLVLALRERRGFPPALRNFQLVQERIKSGAAPAIAAD